MLLQRYGRVALGTFACATLVALLSTGCGNNDTPPIPSGELTFALAFDGAVQVGQNTLRITLKDKTGAAVEGATVTVDPQMPMHGHGSSETAVVTELGQGSYEAFPVTFQMPGMWEITVEATQGGTSASDVIKVTVP